MRNRIVLVYTLWLWIIESRIEIGIADSLFQIYNNNSSFVAVNEYKQTNANWDKIKVITNAEIKRNIMQMRKT